VSVAFGRLQAAISQHPDTNPEQLRGALLETARILLRPLRRTPAAR
jgi:hypothetical protein